MSWPYLPALAACAVVAATLTTGPAAPSSATTSATASSMAIARQSCASVDVIGHRGIGGPHENTIEGFDRAARGGADVVETDVWMTSDDVPVLIHDGRWDRTTNWEGRVRETPYSVVRDQVRTDGGDPIPTLDEAMQWSADNGVGLMVDVKWSPSWDAVAQRAEELGIVDQLTFYARPHRDTGGLGPIDRAREHGLHTGVKAAYGEWPMTPEEIREHGEYVAVAKTRADNPGYVRRMHEAGLRVYPKGSTREWWPGLLDAGVDGLSVANPARYRAWCEGGRQGRRST